MSHKKEPALFSVAIRVASTLVASTVQGNFVRLDGTTRRSLCWKLGASGLLCDFVGGMGGGVANWINHAMNIGIVWKFFKQLHQGGAMPGNGY